MFITDALLRRPVAKVAVAAAAAALAGGLYGAQAANAGSAETPSVIRGATPKGDGNGGRVVARETPGIDERPAPAPAVERAGEPKGSTAGLEPAADPAASDRSDEQPR